VWCLARGLWLYLSASPLTLRAVVPLPALQADAVALLVAGVVAQRVIPRPAVLSASVPEVVLVAEDVVGVAQLALLAEVHVLGPVLADGKPPPGRQAAHEVVLVVCGEEMDIFNTACMDGKPPQQCEASWFHVIWETVPVYSVGDSAFQASMINENVPYSRGTVSLVQ